MIVKKQGNAIVKVVVMVPQSNEASWIPDIFVEVYILGIKVFAKRFNF